MTTHYLTPTLTSDFYKQSHPEQYPDNTSYVFSTWTARTSRIEGVDKIIAFGYQYFVKNYLIKFFNEKFFNLSKEAAVRRHTRLMYHATGKMPNTKFLEELHDLGYLPLHIRAVKEGTLVPIRVPSLTIESTHPEGKEELFYWLTNFIETLLSCTVWGMTTSATIAFEYRKILERYARETNGDSSFVLYQGHDFSMRGMFGLEAAAMSGAGHLLSFIGTDTIPAIEFLEEFYGADVELEDVGTSVPATEHAVMCASGMDEGKTIERLLTEVYPDGIVSVVSDTWDFWNVVGSVLPALKPIIMNRNGKLTIRPDSGDPVLIVCGDPNGETELERKGLIEALYDEFGGTITAMGYKQLDEHIGAIYGDAITMARATEICERLKEKGFASTNIVFGIGSYTYQYNTRDTFGMAMKATHVVIDGVENMIYKDPKTDKGVKKSQKGMVIVFRDTVFGNIGFRDNLTIEERDSLADYDLLEDVFVDGVLVREQTLSEIRSILNEQLEKEIAAV